MYEPPSLLPLGRLRSAVEIGAEQKVPTAGVSTQELIFELEPVTGAIPDLGGIPIDNSRERVFGVDDQIVWMKVPMTEDGLGAVSNGSGQTLRGIAHPVEKMRIDCLGRETTGA